MLSWFMLGSQPFLLNFVGPISAAFVGVSCQAAVGPVHRQPVGSYEQVARGGPGAARERRPRVVRVDPTAV